MVCALIISLLFRSGAWMMGSFTGDIEDFPGVDSLVRFEAEEKDGVIKVRARKSLLEEGRRKRPVCKMTESEQKVLVVGGGGAGQTF